MRIRVKSRLIVLAIVALFSLASFAPRPKPPHPKTGLAFVDELNSHRYHKLQVVYEQDTQDHADTVAHMGYIWHDDGRPDDHAEIVLTNTLDNDKGRSCYQQFYASMSHRITMQDESWDFISIGVADGFWYYGPKDNSKRITEKIPAYYLVARLWKATEAQLKAMNRKELNALGYERHLLSGKITRIHKKKKR